MNPAQIRYDFIYYITNIKLVTFSHDWFSMKWGGGVNILTQYAVKEDIFSLKLLHN